jgi:hypothetical protein
MTSTVRRSSDKGLSRLKRAMDSNQNPLSAAEIGFVNGTGEAARWKHGVADEWYEKGKEVCGSLLEESVGAICEAEEREGAETRI